ncbi:ATP-binding protein [Spirochaetota bacterium]|nr:ATP-binding protein [Spirochaetota bacterium]
MEANSGNLIDSDPSKPLLKVTGIKKSFGEKSILRGIDLAAEKCDVIGILGASGSGKSTFLRCINLLEIPSGGTIYFNNMLLDLNEPPTKFASRENLDRKEISGLHKFNRNELTHKQIIRFRSKIAMVFQSFNLWSHLTALENIIEAPVHVWGLNKREAKEKGMHLLEKVSLTDHASHYPSQLSGGQKQRVAIARALAIDPELILFDEPTSALDPELVHEVLNVIKKLAREKITMLIVSHEIRFSREVANKIAFFYNGKIEELGRTEVVFKDIKSKHFRSFLRHHH